ncbi:hypothetical protein V6N13_061203 [Hibiscus sabdariffa]
MIADSRKQQNANSRRQSDTAHLAALPEMPTESETFQSPYRIGPLKHYFYDLRSTPTPDIDSFTPRQQKQIQRLNPSCDISSSSATEEEADRAKAPFPSALPEAKSPPPCRSQSSDGTWNHTAAAALRARLLRLPVTYALAACPLWIFVRRPMNQSQESSMGLEDLTAFRPRGLQLVLSLFSFTSVVAYCGKESEVSYQGRRRSNSGLGGLPGFAYATVSQD